MRKLVDIVASELYVERGYLEWIEVVGERDVSIDRQALTGIEGNLLILIALPSFMIARPFGGLHESGVFYDFGRCRIVDHPAGANRQILHATLRSGEINFDPHVSRADARRATGAPD